jgi:hypothetical protein
LGCKGVLLPAQALLLGRRLLAVLLQDVQCILEFLEQGLKLGGRQLAVLLLQGVEYVLNVLDQRLNLGGRQLAILLSLLSLLSILLSLALPILLIAVLLPLSASQLGARRVGRREECQPRG